MGSLYHGIGGLRRTWWTRKGVPLHMSCKLPTCGIFPETRDEDTLMGEAPPMDFMQGTKNYSSFYDLIEAEELER